MAPKARWFWPLVLTVVLGDCATKELAVERLSPAQVPHEIFGDAVQLTLTFNPGTAFGVTFGDWQRPLLIVATLIALSVLASLYRRAAPTDVPLGIALALVTGGAVGNLLDRLRSPRGVVDFIDLGLGATRFWTFNVADVGVTLGALLLALLLWRAPSTDAQPISPRA
ncbi:MAG TPA: signal peptidase II [Gemmatimonadaceae bacterium]|nr:signal peptidase II [Gemmatimonadaceae bacterium]